MSPTDPVPSPSSPGEPVPAPRVVHEEPPHAVPPSTSDLLAYRKTPGRRVNFTSAVYGSVLAATVVVSSGDLRAPLTLAVLLLVSGWVFWIAHVYAATVAGVHGGWHTGSIWTGMQHEWPVAFASIPPAAAALIAGLIPGVTASEGVWAALIVCIVEQQLWGYAAVRNARLTGSALTKTVLLNVFMGLVIVGLKFTVGH